MVVLDDIFFITLSSISTNSETVMTLHPKTPPFLVHLMISKTFKNVGV